jgi:hypothetical protein
MHLLHTNDQIEIAMHKYASELRADELGIGWTMCMALGLVAKTQEWLNMLLSVCQRVIPLPVFLVNDKNCTKIVNTEVMKTRPSQQNKTNIFPRNNSERSNETLSINTSIFKEQYLLNFYNGCKRQVFFVGKIHKLPLLRA